MQAARWKGAPLCIWSGSSQLALAIGFARRDNLANQLTNKFPGSAHEVRHFLRAPVAAPLERGRRAPAVPGGARPGRTRRQARHRLRLGSRTPFPRGIFALFRAGNLPRGLLAAHQAHSPRPRHLPDAAEIQPPGAGRRAHRHARSRLQRPRRVRHRRERLPDGARRLQCRLRRGREAADVAGGRRAMHQHDGDGPLSRLQGRVLRNALPQRGAEAAAEAASAAVGGLLQPRDHQDGGALRHRRADLRLRRSARGAAMGR